MIRVGSFIEDRYEILEKIGTGGMSEVYKAKCHKLNRFVAIKFLKQEYCEDKTFVQKFQIEAQSAAALLHPNVVSVYDVNEVDGIYYIVMEYVDGITLKQYIDRNGRLPIKEATSIAIQIGQGIEAAHNANIIHRDIKPQNVLISREGKIKVTDFGIARTTTANTISHDILGSVHYISPEQARGSQVDVRSDIYSFGIVYYEMVTGMLPFDGESTVSIALKHIQETVPLVSDITDNVPNSVVRIIEKCTQKKPERRYQKMASLLSDLKTALISPNEDFVVLEPETAESATILMTGAAAQVLKNGNTRPSGTRSTRYSQPVKEAGNLNRSYEDYEEYDDYDDDYEEFDDYEDVEEDDFIDYEEYDEDEKPVRRKDPSRKKMDKLLLYCGIAAAVIVIIVLAIVVGKAAKGGCGGSGKEKETESIVAESIEMPNVEGKSIEDAKKILADKGFTNVITESVASKDVEKGKVIKQSEKEGSMVLSNKEIKLQVSAGKETVKLDDYKGKSDSDAKDALTKLGLKTKITTQYSDDVETGKVIGTNPVAGSEVAKDTVVEIFVSRGKEVKNVIVPDVLGWDGSEAKAHLESKKLVVKIVEQETDNINDDGNVIDQSIASNKEVPEKTTITITVGRYVEPKPEPPTDPEQPTDPDPEQPTDPDPEQPTDPNPEQPTDPVDEG
ncbi:MAG: Stk1 family PASTA domain-containing Ser/Thr kinase [Lachnospiraceae bacterium]|nr:Stk1 family PASTA domain-containing Ser/Thr kinase [Lachnospiraceae bacterium]